MIFLYFNLLDYSTLALVKGKANGGDWQEIWPTKMENCYFSLLKFIKS